MGLQQSVQSTDKFHFFVLCVLTINCDGIGKIVAGGIRSNNGNWIKGFACFLGSSTSLLAELWAIFIGIFIAREANLDPIIVESNCLYVVNLLNNVYLSSTHHYSTMINLCRSRLVTFSDFEVKHVLREGNHYVDRLAVFTNHSKTDLIVFLSHALLFQQYFFS